MPKEVRRATAGPVLSICCPHVAEVGVTDWKNIHSTAGQRCLYGSELKVLVPMSRVIAVANQKGGVAKTTSVASLGVALCELGRRVLLVDLDPQACLTFSLGLDPESLELSVHDVLLGRVSPGMAVQRTEDGPD